MRGLLLVFILGLSMSCSAQSLHQKIPVHFQCTCSDVVGQLYATAFRDAIATSPRYQEAATAEEKGEKGEETKYNWQVRVVSIDPSKESDGNTTALSVVILIGDSVYLSQIVQTCGRNKAAVCAADTFSSLDGAIHSGSE